MKQVLFSIIIPAFKSRYLAEAIESCLNQTYSNYEIVIVDDASPEGLEVIVSPYLKDPRVRYYRNKKNCGAVNVVDNWNICLNYSKGDYVICMGDDDCLKPCCLEEYNKLIEKYPHLDVYHAWTEIIDENSKVHDIQAMRPEFETVWSLWWHRWNPRFRQYIGDFCYSVNSLRNNGGFFKLPLAWASDDITAVRAAIKGGIANTQKICFAYRKNSQTISNSASNVHKLEAIRKEKLWYDKQINVIPINSYEDKLFKSLILDSYQKHWDIKFAYYLTKDLNNNIFRFWKWYCERKHFGFSIHILLRALKNVLLKKL